MDEPARRSRNGTTWTPTHIDARYVVALSLCRARFTLAAWARMTILLDLREIHPLGIDLGDPS